MNGEGDIAGTTGPEPDYPLEDWSLRPWLLAALGAVAGIIIWQLLEDWDDDSPTRLAIASFIFFFSTSTTFTLTKRRPFEALGFSALLGAVMAGVTFLVLDAGERLAGEEYALGAGVFFSLLAIPLFQAGFHRLRFATPYRDTHFHVWTDAVSAAGAIAFMGLSWLLLWLLHALFSLIGIDAIEELIETGWFAGMFIGATFGGAMGVLRNQLGIIGTLQRVVMLVFALLAVPFAVALLIFLVILLASGGNALWEATDSATPVLLSCAIGAFVLCNAVVRDDDEARSSNAVMQAAALVLAASILPLTLFAAISMGIRIDQHGLSPARIWALIAIIIACAYGIAYWAGLFRGRMAAWSEYLRRANLHLAAVTCVIALVLAMPVVDFGAISARDQIARLESGEVPVEEFDFVALRWDFGDAGRDALAELAQGEGRVAELAVAAQELDERPWGRYIGDEREDGEQLRTDDDYNLRVEPEDPEVRAFILDRMRADPYQCSEFCVALEIGRGENGERQIALIEGYDYTVYVMDTDGAEVEEPGVLVGAAAEGVARLQEDSQVEVREITRRYIVIDGVPMREPLSEGE